RAAQARGAPAPPARGPAAPVQADPVQAPAPSRFDYVGFERRFRGERAAVLATQRERYLELLRHHAPVLDVGCGRGELLAVLAAEGIEAVGVDLEAESVAQAVEAGLDARVGDAVAFLREAEPGSFGAVVSFHVVEHLRLETLLELIELSATRLRPGGVFVAETPNPASLVVLGNSYVLDPTHERPLHPSLMAFLCEGAGFRDVRLEYFAPAEDYHLALVSDPDAPAWVDQVNEAFRRLNHVLFGPQEYAVIATTPPRPSGQAVNSDRAGRRRRGPGPGRPR
ncbi:MAG: class I SAM-dependent methyltransferase, partial [Acidimicrobiales bacterium]